MQIIHHSDNQVTVTFPNGSKRRRAVATSIIPTERRRPKIYPENKIKDLFLKTEQIQKEIEDVTSKIQNNYCTIDSMFLILIAGFCIFSVIAFLMSMQHD